MNLGDILDPGSLSDSNCALRSLGTLLDALREKGRIPTVAIYVGDFSIAHVVQASLTQLTGSVETGGFKYARPTLRGHGQTFNEMIVNLITTTVEIENDPSKMTEDQKSGAW